MRRELVIPALVFFAATISLLVPLPPGTIMFDEIQNTGHSVLFGVLYLFAVQAAGGLGVRSSAKRYWYAAAVTFAFGVLSEVAQHFTGRDPDPYDVLMDTVGIVAFMGFYWTLDKSFSQFWVRVSRWRKWVVRGLSILLLGTAFIALTLWSLAYLARSESFPVLCDFSNRSLAKFVIAQESSLDLVAPPSGWRNAPRAAGRLSIVSGEYPGLRIDEPYSDWRGLKEFCFSIYSENPDTLNFALRIHDSHHNFQFNDRFNARFFVVPGENRYAFPLEQVRYAPAHRETDMAQIASFTIFTQRPPRPVVVYFGKIELR